MKNLHLIFSSISMFIIFYYKYSYFFHDSSMMFVMMITTAVTFVMMWMFSDKFSNSFLLQGHLPETVWTLIQDFNSSNNFGNFSNSSFIYPILRILYLNNSLCKSNLMWNNRTFLIITNSML